MFASSTDVSVQSGMEDTSTRISQQNTGEWSVKWCGGERGNSGSIKKTCPWNIQRSKMQWLHSDMTEKLLTRMLNHQTNQNKSKLKPLVIKPTNMISATPFNSTLITSMDIYVSPRQGRETYCLSPCVCLSVRHKSCPLNNLKTVKDFSMKLGTLVNHDEIMCHAQEP